MERTRTTPYCRPDRLQEICMACNQRCDLIQGCKDKYSPGNCHQLPFYQMLRKMEQELVPTLEGDQKLEYDELLKKLGGFGQFQQIQFAIVSLVSIFCAMHSLNMAFIGATPAHRCHVPQLNLHHTDDDGGSQAANSASFKLPPALANYSHERLYDLYYPKEVIDGEQVISSCFMYNISVAKTDAASADSASASQPELIRTKVRCHQWEYSTDIYTSTIVSEWSLVCDKAWIRGVASSTFFAGRLVGAICVGHLSDRAGRRPVFFFSLVTLAAVGLAVCLSPSLPLFFILYFIQGTLQSGAYITAYVLGTELVGPNHRKMVSLAICVFYAGGIMLLSGIAHSIREWRYLNLAISLPVLVILVGYKLMPESVRWLISQDRRGDAEVVLVELARRNNKTHLETLVERLDWPEPNAKKYSILDVFRHGWFTLVAIDIWFVWLATALIYYGLILDSATITSNPWGTFAASAAIEIPGFCLCYFLLDHIGRCRLACLAYLITAVVCFMAAFIFHEASWVLITLALIGRFAIASAYAILSLLTAEVFPTVVRTAGLGMANVCGRIGGTLAPQILLLGQLYKTLPLRLQYLVFGVLAVISALLIILVPEPSNKQLPQTFDDVTTRKSQPAGESEMQQDPSVTTLPSSSPNVAIPEGVTIRTVC